MNRIYWNDGNDVFYAHLGTRTGMMVGMISVHEGTVMVTYHDQNGWHPAVKMESVEKAKTFIEENAN